MTRTNDCRNMTRTIFCLVLTALLASCAKPEDRALEEALAFAGDNRPELEKVLAHYEGDSLKLEAAKFLIRNMPGHYSYADSSAVNRYALAVDAILESMRGQSLYAIRDSIDRTAERMGIGSLETVQDCRVITADFLIRNIDTAFHDWQQGPWARHVCFGDFCEWILPYKTEELQPLDDWRTRLKDFCAENLYRLDYCDQMRNLPQAAVKVLNRSLAKALNPVTGFSVRHAHIPTEYRAGIPFGLCSDYAQMAASILRSHGIPVSIDFTPQWAKHHLGHTWDVLISENGQRIPFGGICDEFEQMHKYEEKMPKAYRHTYAYDRELAELNRCGEHVPGMFRNIFVRDVTRETIQCCDVTLRADRRETGGSRYAYLHVFDNKDWVPVAFGKIRHGRVTFRDMGPNILYLPATYGNGRMEPMSEPFVLDYDGTVRYVTADTCRRQDMVLERKHPVMKYTYKNMTCQKGGEFQASNDAGFRDYRVVHRIAEEKVSGQYVGIDDSVPPFRYWRYINNRHETYCNMAEIMFYGKGDSVRLQGRVIGTDGSLEDDPGHRKETVFDGSILTSFEAPVSEGGWVGLDLGKPTKMDHIIYYGRSDGNCVEMGDEYELLYWGDGQWRSLGKQTARHLYVDYRNVPADGLYLLKDRTKGSEERVFTYEDGRQVWW